MNDHREWILAGKPPEQPLLRTRKRRLLSTPSRAAEEESFTEVAIRREAIRQANHRSTDRHRLDNQQVELVHDGRRQTVTLVSLSGGGAMIEGAEDLKLWDVLTMRFGDCAKVDAAVRWIRGKRVGLEFAEETRIGNNGPDIVRMLETILGSSRPDLASDPAANEKLPSSLDPSSDEEPPAGEEPERELRHSLIWSGHIHYDYDTIPVRLRNISEGGALIESGRPLKVGSELLLDLDKAGSFFATVCWAHGDAAGLRFNGRFDLHKLAAARHTLASTRWVAPDHVRHNNSGASPWSRQRADAAAASDRPRRSIRR